MICIPAVGPKQCFLTVNTVLPDIKNQLKKAFRWLFLGKEGADEEDEDGENAVVDGTIFRDNIA